MSDLLLALVVIYCVIAVLVFLVALVHYVTTDWLKDRRVSARCLLFFWCWPVLAAFALKPLIEAAELGRKHKSR